MKQQKKKKGRSVQELLGIRTFTKYGLSTNKGELLFYLVSPTNISVLSHTNIEIKIRHLMMLKEFDKMEIVMDNELKLAQVWCSHADQRDEAKQQKLKEFIADCRKEKIFVCVYESGDGSLLENTKELLANNLNNPTPRTRTSKSHYAR